MATLKGVIRSAKAVAKGYSDLELKVRQATCNDKWGPSSHLLQELLMASELGSDGRVILEVLDRRLNDSGKNWRHVYKSLSVYQFLIENGPEYIVNHAKRNLPAIKTLKEYQYVDETGVDHGQNVRVKSRELSALLVDDHKLGQIRANRGKNGPTNTLQYSHTGNDNDDELQRAIELSREQASIDERRRKQLELQRQELLILILEKKIYKEQSRQAKKKLSIVEGLKSRPVKTSYQMMILLISLVALKSPRRSLEILTLLCNNSRCNGHSKSSNV